MLALLFTASVCLAQAEPAAEAPPEASAPAAPSEPSPGGTFRPSRAPSAEELQRQVERIRKLPATPSAPDDGPPALEKLSDPEQVKLVATSYFRRIIAADARGLVLWSGFPFYLEDRRLEFPDELHKEWLKNLRSKRTDLITLYDVEVLTPQEMEKKHGKPPARLANMPWRNPKTLIAVGNLSGRAAVMLLRPSSGEVPWQVVGYSD